MFEGVGCTTLQAQTQARFAVGTIVDVGQHQSVSFEDLIPHLLAADVIFIGEEHYTPSHLEAAQQILETLLTLRRQPTVAMEMFSWDGQPSLNHYIEQPTFSVDQLLKGSRWKDNWGGEFSDYQSLVIFSKTNGLNLLALNPPRPLVRSVARKGLDEALKSPEMSKWSIGEIVSDDPEYEQLIFNQIEVCHPGMPKHAYRRFFEASIFRDHGMAQIITHFLETRPSPQAPLVSYTGGGHIQYRIPIPKRVLRKRPDTKILTIYLVAWDPSKKDEVEQAITENIADFLWLTSLGPQGVQPRCG